MQLSPCSPVHFSSVTSAALLAVWLGWWRILVPRTMKAYKSVPHWKHFSCQNVKTGNIFNINLFPRLLFTFSVSARNVFDAVQICPISSLSPFAVVRWGQLGPGSVSSLLSTRLEQSMCLSLFLPTPPPWCHLPADLGVQPPLLLSPLSLRLPLPLIPGSSFGPTTSHWGVLLPCWHLLLVSHDESQATSTSGKEACSLK